MSKRMLKKMAAKGSLVVAGTFGLAASAFADLNAAIAPGITTVETDGIALQTLIWPALIAIVVGFKIMGMFKKGVSKIG